MPEFELARKSWWREKVALVKTYRAYLQSGPAKEVNHLLLFVGYPRSGHTLVGALLDAHPEIVVAHQAYALGYLQQGIAKVRVLQLLLDNSVRFTRAGRDWMGYNYQVPGQWQGKYKNLQIIGDKSGGITTRTFFHNGGLSEVDEVVARTGLKITFIHVLRNPYDMISTMTKRAISDQGHPDTEATFHLKIKHFLKHAEGVALLKKHAKYRVLDIKHESLVAATTATLESLCTSLGTTASRDYLAACDKLVWDNSKKSRHSLPYWTVENKRAVATALSAYPWLATYTYND